MTAGHPPQKAGFLYKTHRVSLPEGSPTGYSARGTGGVFLEEESAAADADFSVSPRQSRGVLHTNKKTRLRRVVYYCAFASTNFFVRNFLMCDATVCGRSLWHLFDMYHGANPCPNFPRSASR